MEKIRLKLNFFSHEKKIDSQSSSYGGNFVGDITRLNARACFINFVHIILIETEKMENTEGSENGHPLQAPPVPRARYVSTINHDIQ